MDRRKFRPGNVESLETLALLTSVVPAMTPLHAHALHLAGTLSGAATHDITVDTGTTNTLSGSGQVMSLGQVTVSGDVERTGYILLKHRPVNGSLLLSNDRGTVQLSLHSTDPRQTGAEGLPNAIPFKVTGGTGAYAHATGRGIARVTFQIPVDPGSPSGFTLTLKAPRGR
jgi:hypothetical protein